MELASDIPTTLSDAIARVGSPSPTLTKTICGCR
jgi:hypothetical protein